jgi:hypothetical protein
MRGAALPRSRLVAFCAAFPFRGGSIPHLGAALARQPPTPRRAPARPRARSPAAAAARARLRALEASMTPSQVSTYRVFAAVRHSAHLAGAPALRAQWLEALGALGSFLDLVPTQGAGRGGGGLLGAPPFGGLGVARHLAEEGLQAGAL